MDQASGLGPDEMQFTMNSAKWYPEFKKWERDPDRRPGDLPPGVVKKPKAVRRVSERDYVIVKDEYLLRPEVSDWQGPPLQCHSVLVRLTEGHDF